MQGIEPTNSCTQCTRLVKARSECIDCLVAICNQCKSNDAIREKFLKDHKEGNPRHRSFRDINPPYTMIKPPSSWKCGCLSIHGLAGHCSRCFESQYRFNIPKTMFLSLSPQYCQPTRNSTAARRVRWNTAHVRISVRNVKTRRIPNT